jgi:hypothetical protein
MGQIAGFHFFESKELGVILAIKTTVSSYTILTAYH